MIDNWVQWGPFSTPGGRRRQACGSVDDYSGVAHRKAYEAQKNLYYYSGISCRNGDEHFARIPTYLKYFDVTNAGFAWREPRPEQIIRRRADMNDKFIFDILLISGGVREPDTLFPPRNVEDLEALLLSIENSTYDLLKKECLVYLLLKWHQDGREERFQLERCIPSHFAGLADAYWHLDTGINVSRAVSILSDSRLKGEYASKIMHAISISSNPSPLIVQYVRTAKPPLTEPQDLWMYTLALADSSLLEAWLFQRTFNETDELRKQLLEKLLHWCIFPEPHPKALTTLLSLPLSSFEEKILREFALQPPKSLPKTAIATIRDLICVRFIQSGKYAEAIKADHQFASSTLDESKTDAQARRKMVRDVYDALPHVERMLLDLELDGLAHRPKPTTNGVIKPSADTDNPTSDLSQSWEEVPRPLSSQPLNDSHPVVHAPYRDILQLNKSHGEVGPAPRPGGPSSHSMFSMGAPRAHTISFPATNGLNRASSMRQSFPLSSSTSGRPQPLLTSGSGQLTLSAQTGTLSSSGQLPSHTQPLSASTTFTPASRQQNAFYQPPPIKHQSSAKLHHEGQAADSSTRDMSMDGVEGGDHDMDIQHDDEASQAQEEAEGEEEERDVEPRALDQRRSEQGDDEMQGGIELGFSVFGKNKSGINKAPQPTPGTKVRSGRGSAATATTAPVPAATPDPASASASASASAPAPAPVRQRTSKRAPPGAFMSDDEDGGEEGEGQHAARSRTSTRTRQNQNQNQNQNQDNGAGSRIQSNKRAKRPRKEDLGRSLPGTLIEEDDDDDNDDGDNGHDDGGEEADHIAPLPQQPQSPPLRRNARRARSTTPASDVGAGEEDGAQKRRRSSRLSGMDTSPPTKKSSGAKGRKSTTSTSTGGVTRKKRS